METFWKAWCVVALWTSVSAMEMLEEESDYSDWTMISQYRGLQRSFIYPDRGLQRSYNKCKKFSYWLSDDGCNKCICFGDRWICAKEPCSDRGLQRSSIYPDRDLQRSYKNCKKFSYRPSDDGCNKCICFGDRWICAKEPCSENMGCTDFHIECKRLKEQTGCTRYWMKKICPKTCGACSATGTNSAICEDMSTKCTKWAVQGKCSKGHIYWKCKATCACGTGSNPCEDTHSKCQKWASVGKCGIKKVFKKCKSSCPCDLPCKCGIPNRKDINLEKAPKIIGGGNVAFARKYPWQVSIQQGHHRHAGGGSIINDRWILTAAHVIIDVKSCTPFYDHRPFSAFVGEHDLYNMSDNSPDTRFYGIKQYIPHPKFVCKTFNYDFALLELIEPIPFNDVIRPICLPEDDSKNYVGETGTVIGWGRISSEFHYYAKILQELNVKIHANTDCQKWNTDHYSGPIPSNQMCVAHAVYWNKTACHGDSGGPLFVYEKNRYVQVGIVSHGMSCHSPGYPGIFARVTTVLKWISTTTTNGKKCVN